MNLLLRRPFPLNRLALLAVAVSAIGVLTTHAQVVNLNLAGTTSYDGWNNLSRVTYTGFPSFPGRSSWPGPIDSRAPGSGDAEMTRLAIAADGTGGGYPAEESLYFFSSGQVPNALGGTLRIEDTTPVAGVKTVALQIQIGGADGYDFVEPHGIPVLRINGLPTNYASMQAVLLAQYQNGTFLSPETEQEEPVFVTTWGFQWEVSTFGPITSIQIDFSVVTHAQIYAMRLDQSSQTYSTSVFTNGGTTETREIVLGGSLDFGKVVVGSSATRTLTIANQGNTPLNITGVTHPSPAFSGDWSGTLPAGGSQDITVTFSPAAASTTSGTTTVSSDATSGVNEVNVSGSGTPPVLRQDTPGTPQFDGNVTIATHRFHSTPDTLLLIEYTDTISDSNSWVRHPGEVPSGTGQFDVTFSAPGDHRESWSRGMFFRLIYPE